MVEQHYFPLFPLWGNNPHSFIIAWKCSRIRLSLQGKNTHTAVQVMEQSRFSVFLLACRWMEGGLSSSLTRTLVSVIQMLSLCLLIMPPCSVLLTGKSSFPLSPEPGCGNLLALSLPRRGFDCVPHSKHFIKSSSIELKYIQRYL